MPLFPAELRNTDSGAKAAIEIERAMRAARGRISRHRTLGVVASTLALPIMLAAAWVALLRFTLLDLPGWPALLFIVVWLVAMLGATRLQRVTSGESARYLDRALRLDERLSTLLELAHTTPVKSLSRHRLRLPAGLFSDTAHELTAREDLMPTPWAYRLKLSQSVAISAALIWLTCSLLLPTPLDAERVARATLQRTVNAELARINQLKAELITRPGLSTADRHAIEAELTQLETELTSPNIDRSAILAALSDAQQRLQQLSPQTTADFESIMAAARSVQLAAMNGTRDTSRVVETGWDPANFPNLSDFAKAADAASVLSTKAAVLTSSQIRLTAPVLERASNQAAPGDAELAQHLLDASRAVAEKDAAKGTAALTAASERFREADHKYELAQSVEKIMSSLDDGRQTLAQAGTQSARKGQVGFRRPGTAGQAGLPAGQAQGKAGGSTSDSGGDQANEASQGVTLNGPSALGANMGSNSPDYGGAKSGAPSSAGNSSGQGSSQGGGQANAGGTQAGSPGAPGSGGAAKPGAGSSGSDDGTQGTFSGQVSGSVGGGSGAISQVPNPQGQGIATDSPPSQSGAQQDDSVYVPPADYPGSSEAAGSVPGQAAPEEKPGGIQGRNGDGGDGQQSAADKGAGARSQIRTPYTEVIGDYAQRATNALERVYVPADAKEYVKDYFSALGK